MMGRRVIPVHLVRPDVLELMVRLVFLVILATEVNLATLGLDLRVRLEKKAIVVKLVFEARKVVLAHPDLLDQWDPPATEVPMDK